MNYAKNEDIQAKKDEEIVQNDVTVLVDPKATFYIAGTVMDYEVRKTGDLHVLLFC
jgi:Fe-S cluster assembly iron-binding protein IscA